MKENSQVIIKVIETYHANQANKYIGAGWVLLNTVPGKDEQGFPLVMYVLGQPPGAEEPDLF